MVKSCHILCMCGFSKHNCEALSAKKSVISTGLGHGVMESWSHGTDVSSSEPFFGEDFSPMDARLPCSGSSIGRPAAQLAVKKHVRNHAVYQRWQAGQS